MKPSVGRIVHYTNLGDKDGKYPPQVQAAMITGVYTRGPDGELYLDNTGLGMDDVLDVDLKVFYRTGLFDCVKIPYSASGERGHWSWPKIG